MLIAASKVIQNVQKRTKYTRSHVANIMRRFPADCGAEKRGARWYIENANRTGYAETRLEKVVLRESGPRRRLKETDPREN